MTEQELQKMWDGLEVDLKERFGKSASKDDIDGIRAVIRDLEQKMVRRGRSTR